MKKAACFILLGLTIGLAGLEAQRGRGMKHPEGTQAPKPLDPGRPWGWAVRAYMQNPDQKLYNTAKQKLLDGKQVFSHTIARFDAEAYCRQAPHFDFTWFEMQHSTMTYAEVEKMVATCPRAGATPILRIPDALEANVQKAMDIGMLGIIVPTVDDALEARESARYARFPPVARVVHAFDGFDHHDHQHVVVDRVAEGAAGRDERRPQPATS